MFWLWLVQTRMEVWYQNSIWNEEWIETGDSGIKIDANNRIICRSDPKQTRCFVGNRLKTQIWSKTNKSFLFLIKLVKRSGRICAYHPAGLGSNSGSAEIFCLLLSSWTVETKPIKCLWKGVSQMQLATKAWAQYNKKFAKHKFWLILIYFIVSMLHEVPQLKWPW